MKKEVISLKQLNELKIISALKKFKNKVMACKKPKGKKK